MGKRRENVLEAAVGWTNGAREKMGWKKFGRRRVGSERREGIGWKCSGRVEGRGRSEVIGLGAFLGVGERRAAKKARKGELWPKDRPKAKLSGFEP